MVDGIAKPFDEIVDRKVIQTKPANWGDAVRFTHDATQFFAKNARWAGNVTYARLVEKRARYFDALGQRADARRELDVAIPTLADRGLAGTALNRLTDFQSTL